MREYKGSLNHRNELPPKVSKAYRAYKNQRTRCNNKNVRSYRDYGKRNIKVEYTARQLVQWFLDNYNDSIPL